MRKIPWVLLTSHGIFELERTPGQADRTTMTKSAKKRNHDNLAATVNRKRWDRRSDSFRRIQIIWYNNFTHGDVSMIHVHELLTFSNRPSSLLYRRRGFSSRTPKYALSRQININYIFPSWVFALRYISAVDLIKTLAQLFQRGKKTGTKSSVLFVCRRTNIREIYQKCSNCD